MLLEVATVLGVAWLRPPQKSVGPLKVTTARGSYKHLCWSGGRKERHLPVEAATTTTVATYMKIYMHTMYSNQKKKSCRGSKVSCWAVPNPLGWWMDGWMDGIRFF